jgi:septal ring-binding cell division protein DamX
MLKVFFLLLLAAFGALMFVAGTLAPSNVKAPIEQLAANAAATFSGAGHHGKDGAASLAALTSPGLSASPSLGVAQAITSADAMPATGQSASGTVTPAISPVARDSAVYAASSPIASLLVPAPPPASGHYALQAATFTSSDAASLFADSVSKQGYKATIVPITDSGQPFIVAVGDYPSSQAANADQLTVGRDLKSTALPPVVLLPPPPAH